MASKPRPRPKRLAEKLCYIRLLLGLSQNGLVRRLGVEGLTQSNISEFETGRREPSLLILLQYSRLAGVHLEDLVDDEADLPARLPVSARRKA
jgi:transcriptional regulator with XRE-family HTH domain